MIVVGRTLKQLKKAWKDGDQIDIGEILDHVMEIERDLNYIADDYFKDKVIVNVSKNVQNF